MMEDQQILHFPLNIDQQIQHFQIETHSLDELLEPRIDEQPKQFSINNHGTSKIESKKITWLHDPYLNG